MLAEAAELEQKKLDAEEQKFLSDMESLRNTQGWATLKAKLEDVVDAVKAQLVEEQSYDRIVRLQATARVYATVLSMVEDDRPTS